MEVRWHIYKRYLTVDKIRQYSKEHGCGMMEAQRKLMEQKKVLEVYDKESETWKEVPEVTTFIDGE